MVAIRLGTWSVMVERTAAPRRAPLAAVAAAWRDVREMWRAWSTRRQLRDADDRTLADLGISRAQARFEAERAPWDVEVH